jgi:bacillithiol synthase
MQLQCNYISHSATNSFQKIVLDYLAQKHELSELISFSSDDNGLLQAASKRQFSKQARSTLVTHLTQQYDKYEKSQAVTDNIALLSKEKTFTVCTAHQPLIFTGTLFFIYKIAHAIKLSQHCKSLMPYNNFVPLLYLGTEDADIDEIGTFNFRGKQYKWDLTTSQCVGRIKTSELQLLLLEVKRQIDGSSIEGAFLIDLFEEAYNRYETLAEATIYIVHKLFACFGLLVIDPDSHDLKQLFAATMRTELLQQEAKASIAPTNQRLRELGYTPQAHGRDINLFYILRNQRHIIVSEEDKWLLVDTQLSFTKDQLLQELANHPENFSPNVLMRPMYQETIMPNIAFIGGGGELAYWLQQKQLFEHNSIDFPVLVLRQSYAAVPSAILDLQRKLALPLVDGFLPAEQLIKQKLVLSESMQDLSSRHAALLAAIAAYEDTAMILGLPLAMSVAAHQAKMRRITNRLDQKFRAHVKMQESDYVNQVQKFTSALKPNGGLQERQEVFIEYYLEWGGERFIEQIVNCCLPFGNQFGLLTQ